MKTDNDLYLQRYVIRLETKSYFHNLLKSIFYLFEKKKEQDDLFALSRKPH